MKRHAGRPATGGVGKPRNPLTRMTPMTRMTGMTPMTRMTLTGGRLA